MTFFLPNENDAKILQRLISGGRGPAPSRSRSVEEADILAPDVYIAKPKESSGIPALTVVSGESVPGEAECEIYHILPNTSGDPELKKIEGVTHTVYNLSTSALTQDWIQVQRDKHGSWLVVTSKSTDIGLFQILAEKSPGSSVLANRLTLGTGAPSAGTDEYTLYDPSQAIRAHQYQRLWAWLDGLSHWQIISQPVVNHVSVRLTTALSPGLTATGLLQEWDPITSAYTDGASVTVKDYSGGHWGVPGEVIECHEWMSSTTSKIEVVNSGADSHEGILSTGLSAGSTASVIITVDGTSTTLTGQDVFLPDDAAILGVGTAVLLTFDLGSGCWLIAPGKCA